MAYERSSITPRIVEVEQQLSTQGRTPPVGEILDAVVAAETCGRGVAQQVLAELRKSRANDIGEVQTSPEPSSSFPAEIENLLRSFEDISRTLGEVRASVGRSVEAYVVDTKASLAAIIADQGVASLRSDEDSRAEISRLEAVVAQAQAELSEAGQKVEEGERRCSGLSTRLTEAEEVVGTLRAQTFVLEEERTQHHHEAANLRTALEGCRRDLEATRQAEEKLRSELRTVQSETIARHLYEALQSRLVDTEASLAEERTRNAELHAQVVRLVGAMTSSAEKTTALPA